MPREIKKSKKSRQDEAISLYKKGFSQKEIAEILGINQSTVSRYFNNPTKHEVEDFYRNYAYGAKVTEDDRKIFFNRRYQLLNPEEKDIETVKTEYYYNDGTYWPDRFYHSTHRIAIYDSQESWEEYKKLKKSKYRKR